jgi:hypothetical protein
LYPQPTSWERRWIFRQSISRHIPERTNLDCAVFATWLQPKNAKSIGHHHALLAIIRRRNALKKLEALQSGLAPCALVGDHAANGTVQDLGWGAVVEGAGFFGVNNVAFVKEVVVPQLRVKDK